MTNVSRPFYQALVIPDARLTVWRDECVGLEATAGGHVGQPVDTSDTPSALTLRALRRERSGTYDEITVQASAAGIANEAAALPSQAGAFIWYKGGMPYGWNAPHVLSGWRSLLCTDGTGLSAAASQPHIVLTSERTALLIYQVDVGSGPLIGKRNLIARRLVEGAADWGAPIAVRTGLDGATDACPCLMPLPDGRVMLYWVNAWTDGAFSGVGVAACYSDDDGASWSNLDTYIASDLDEPAVKMRAACNGQGEAVLLVSMDKAGATYTSSICKQFGSIDFGATFETVGITTDAAGQGVAHAEVLWSGDAWAVAYLVDADNHPRVARLGSAFTQIHSADVVTASSLVDYWARSGTAPYTVGGSGLALVRDDTGDFWLYGIDSGDGPILTSRDLITWTSRGAGTDGTWWQGNASGNRPAQLSAVMHEGRVIMAHTRNAVGAEGNLHEASIAVTYIAGYSSLTSPPRVAVSLNDDRLGWAHTWLPYDEPADAGWTKTGSVTSETIDTTGALHLSQTGSTSTITYTRGLNDHGEAWGEWQAVTPSTNGGTASAEPMFLQVLSSDGTAHTYGMRITMSATDLVLFQVTGAGTYTQLSSATIAPPTNAAGDLVPVAVKWVVYGNRMHAWYRYATDAAVQTWTELGEYTGMTNIWAVSTSSQIAWGARLVSGAQGWIYGVHHSQSQSGRAAVVYNAYAAQLNGRKFGADGVYVTDGVALAALGGPAVAGETWTVNTVYDFDIERVLEPGPRRGYQTTDTDTEVSLAFRWSSDGDSPGPTDVLAIPLIGTNVGQATIEVYEAATSSWVLVEDVDLTVGALRWARSGDTVSPRSGSYVGYPTPLVQEGEWDGCQFVRPASANLIRSSSAGKWTSNTTLKPRLSLVGIGALPSTGAFGHIVARDSVALVSMQGGAYSGVRVTLKVPDGTDLYPTAEGYWRIGSMPIGWLHVFPDEYSWGRVVSVASNRDLITFNDGTKISRIQGPAARTVEFGWPDGVDTLGAATDDDSPSVHQLDDGGEVIALDRTTPSLMEGLFARLAERQRDDLVYLPRVEAFESGEVVKVVNRRRFVLAGRIASTEVRQETVQGDEGVDEVVRIGVVTLEELR